MIRPGLKRLAPQVPGGRKAAPARPSEPAPEPPVTHAPPRARTSTENELPSIIVAPDSWNAPTRLMPPRPKRAGQAGGPAGDEDAPKRTLEPTVIIPAAALAPAPARRTRAGVILGALALALGAAALYALPMLTRLVDGALAVVR